MNNFLTHILFWYSFIFLIYAMYTAAGAYGDGKNIDHLKYWFAISGFITTISVLTYFYINL